MRPGSIKAPLAGQRLSDSAQHTASALLCCIVGLLTNQSSPYIHSLTAGLDADVISLALIGWLLLLQQSAFLSSAALTAHTFTAWDARGSTMAAGIADASSSDTGCQNGLLWVCLELLCNQFW